MINTPYSRYNLRTPCSSIEQDAQHYRDQEIGSEELHRYIGLNEVLLSSYSHSSCFGAQSLRGSFRSKNIVPFCREYQVGGFLLSSFIHTFHNCYLCCCFSSLLFGGGGPSHFAINSSYTSGYEVMLPRYKKKAPLDISFRSLCILSCSNTWDT